LRCVEYTKYIKPLLSICPRNQTVLATIHKVPTLSKQRFILRHENGHPGKLLSDRYLAILPF
jgi:hypothetical protein